MKLVIGVCLVVSFGVIANAMNKMPPPPAKLYPKFSRQCPMSEAECKFISKDNPDAALYFKCRENRICFCSRGTAPADVLVWPVQWEEETCQVAKGGPCGEDRGLVVDCQPGLNCLQGRCRNSSEIHNGQLNEFCNDDIDCQSGLSCQLLGQNMEIQIKRCM